MPRLAMNRTLATLMVTVVSCAACAACGQASQPGTNSAAVSSPTGWQCGATGGGKPQWTLEKDASGLQVLKQSGIAPYPWCVKPGVKLTDGFVEVRFKPIAGREDQAGGVVWRWQNGDHYYVARANALENNLSLYYTSGGTRHTLQYVNAPVAPNTWHRLRVEFTGPRITVSLDGKPYITATDTHIGAAGSVGVWTKSDSVTVFDDFSAGPLKHPP